MLQEIEHLRARLAELPERARQLEERLLATKGQLAQAESQRDRLSTALRDTREQIESLRNEVAQLSAPPSGYGVIVEVNDDGTVDVVSSGRKVRVHVSPEVTVDDLERGAEVLLNDAMNIVMVRRPDIVGDGGHAKGRGVEVRGFEPLAFSLRTRRSTN